MRQLFPPVRIHSWGGLGSQLFAIALAEDFKVIYPKRSLRIILHTGGVTRRIPEVVDLFPDFEYQYIEDFQPKRETSKVSSSKSQFDSKNYILKVFTALRFLANCNDDISTRRLLPWVLSIRGHYSYRSVNSNFLRQLAKLCQSFDISTIPNLTEACVVHYRLGDLLIIAEKSPISVNAVASEFMRVQNHIHFSSLILFSDSPSEAQKRFSPLIAENITVLNSETILVIASAIRAKYFIGTSSKISFWIAGIRAVVNENRSSLPAKNVKHYEKIAVGSQNLIAPYITDS